MKILDKYIAKTVIAAIGLVTLMLVGLQIFILLVNQMGDLGKADFGFGQATIYVLLQLPYQVYLFFPMASLLGCLIGLGLLASSSELVVMRASGMSIGQITFAVFKAAMVLILIVTILGETLVPFLSSYANDKKMIAVSGGQSLRTTRGLWLRHDLDFIHIEEVLPDNVLQKVYQFSFDKTHRLQKASFIREIKYENKQWQAYGINQTTFNKESTSIQNNDKLPWDVGLKPQVLSVSAIDPEEMSLYALHRFLRIQKNNNQNVQNYQLSYWHRLIQPLTTLVMMLLAIPFIFGPLRSSTMGAKLLAGATVGFGFHILNQFLGPISFVFQWPAVGAAVLPTLLFALLGVYLMRKMR
jgi:lipopolysaccharide export system permease protein